MIARLVAVVALVSSVIAGVPNAALANDDTPIVVAHRTAMNYAPENTVAGINKAADMGAKWVEMDVRWNASNFPWLMHDADVSRTTDGTGAISSLYYGPIQKLNAADYAPWNDAKKYPQYKYTLTASGISTIRPPYAYEFMAAVVNRNMNALFHVVATPTQAQADKFVDYLHRPEFGNLEARSIFMGSVSAVTAFKSFYPNEPIKYFIIDYPTDGMIRNAQYLKSLGVVGYTLPYDSSTTASLVQYYHSNGIQVFFWTSNLSPETTVAWKQIANANADAIISNEFDKVAVCYADLADC